MQTYKTKYKVTNSNAPVSKAFYKMLDNAVSNAAALIFRWKVSNTPLIMLGQQAYCVVHGVGVGTKFHVKGSI